MGEGEKEQEIWKDRKERVSARGGRKEQEERQETAGGGSEGRRKRISH